MPAREIDFFSRRKRLKGEDRLNIRIWFDLQSKKKLIVAI
jgi:hypothetical protein